MCISSTGSTKRVECVISPVALSSLTATFPSSIKIYVYSVLISLFIKILKSREKFN